MRELDKKYILEALKKGIEKEKLEEIGNLNIAVADNNIPRYARKSGETLSNYKKRISGYDQIKKFGINKSPIDDDLYSKMGIVAAIADPGTDINQKDFRKAFSYGGVEANRKKIVDFFDKYGSNASKKEVQKMVDAYNAMTDNNLSSDEQKERAKVLAGLLANVSDSTTQVDAVDTTDAFGTPDLARDVQSVATFDKKAKQAGEQNQKTDFKNFNGFIRTSESIKELFSAVPGSTITERLKVLQDFGAIVKESDLKTKVDNMNARESFQFMNNAAAYLALADLGKHYDGVSSGLAFEKYLAVMFNMPVAGGSNGAADNIMNIPGVSSDNLFFSAKMYKDAGMSAISQSFGDEFGQGILAMVKNSGESVLYITVLKYKKGDQQDSQYNRLNIYLTRVFYDELADNGKGKYKSDFYISDGAGGAKVEATFELDQDSKKIYLFPQAATAYGLKNSPTYVVETPTIDAESLGLTAKYLQQQTENTTNDLIRAIKSAYVNSQKMEQSVRGYNAKKSKGEGAVDFVKNLKKSFNDIFFNLKEVITQGETVQSDQKEKDEGEAFTKGADFKFQDPSTSVSESKQLIDLIREMAKNELKDIDFE